MKPILKQELELYLEDIMQQLENTFDFFEKRRLEYKKNAIEILLGLPNTQNSVNIYRNDKV